MKAIEISSMKAVRVHAYGGPEALVFEDAPDPSPGPGQLLIKVEAAGVNFIEVYHRTGLYPVSLPAIPGTEAAGTVLAVGPGVSGIRTGDAVASTNVLGAYAERALVAADRAVSVPSGVTTRQAAAVMLQGMTAHYLTHSTFPLRRGHTCLVHAAAGGVGLLLCQVAKLRGARVIGTTSNRDKAALAKQAGADEVILYTETDFVAEVKRLTNGAGVDVVYDSVGRSTFEKSLECVVPRGMAVLFGASSGPVPPFDLQTLNRRGSLFTTRPRLDHYIPTREELTQRAGDVLGWVRDGKLRVRVFRELPLSQAAEAHRMLEARATTGKLLLIPGA
jgi:NADPH2:quinone reductase